MDQQLTVVLPVHNCERQLRSSVQDILDLVLVMRQSVAIVVVDDGSTDDTYETACELARQYPQLRVLRQSIRQGIGAALELVRNRLSVEMVLVHDGVSSIDASQLQAALNAADSTDRVVERPDKSTGSRRFSAIRALHNQMEQAHRSATSFRWIQLDQPLVPRRRSRVESTSTDRPIGGAPLTLPSSQLSMGMVPTPPA
ncbi:MAG: glycosyltransferase [Planctomycetota bacterium]